MQIKKVTTAMRFRNKKGLVYGFSCADWALYEDGRGFISLDGENIYFARGGKKALQSIIDMGGFKERLQYIQPINN